MTPSEQHETTRCMCGGVLRYRQTASPWEFEGRCETCVCDVLISWAHVHQPPVFVADPQKQRR